MPIGFICLGVFLITQVFYEKNILNKWLSVIFCVFTMSGYLMGTIYFNKVSINLIFLISTVLILFFSLSKLSGKEKLNVLFQSVAITLTYVLLTKINSDFISILNPYPLCFLLLVFSVLNLTNFYFVLALNAVTFIFVSISNLIVESGLQFVYFASLELFDLIILIITIMLVVKLILINLNKIKRGNLWKNF